MHAAAHLQRSHHALVAPKRPSCGMTSSKQLMFSEPCKLLHQHTADCSCCSPKPCICPALSVLAKSSRLDCHSCLRGASVRAPSGRSRAITPVTAYLPPAAPPASADVVQAFKRLQNGSDVRGVALAGTADPSVVQDCSHDVINTALHACMYANACVVSNLARYSCCWRCLCGML
jgi:hypothetical protein